MAIKVGGTEVVSNSRELKNIASIDSGTVTAFNSALNTDPTKGTLTKTFAQNETADITLSSNVTVGPVVSATKEVPQTGVSTKGNWDVNSTASNYDFHNTAANVTLTPSTTTTYNFATTSNAANSFAQSSSAYNSEVGSAYPQGFSWAGNGMYYYIARDKMIYRYELTTAYDLTTASLSSNQSFNTASTFNQDIADIYVTNDGTQLFTVHSSISKYVARYTMSTAHDLYNLSYQNNVNLQSYSGNVLANPNSVTFKPDGTIMYITDFNSAIFSYSINSSYPFNVGYVTAQTGAEGFGSEISNSTGVRGSAFTSDGTKMYILDDSASENIVEYTLSTPWTISSKSYTNNSFHYKPLLSTHLDNVPSLTLINDNAFVFLDNNSAKVRKVSFGATTTNALTLGSGSFASTDVGKRIVGNGGDVILTSTGGAFSTTGGSAFTDNSTIAAGSWSMFGLKSAGDADGITISSLGIETAAYDSQKSLANDTSSPQDVDFNLDGGKAYVVDNLNDRIIQYNLSTPYNLSTASQAAIFGISSQDGVPTGIFVAQTKMIVCGKNSNKLHLYNLGSNYNIQNSSFYQDFNLNTNGSYSTDTRGVTCQLDANGNIAQIFTVSQSDTNVRHWTPAALNQVSNLSLTRSLDLANVSGITGTPQGHGIRFNNNGTKLFIVDENAEVVYRLGLTTAYDISTASHEVTFDISTNSTQPTGIALGKSDDSIMFITTNTPDLLQKYNLTSNFTQPTQQYHVGVTNSGGQIDSSSFTDINSTTAAQAAGTGTVHYAVSTDGRTTWSVAKGTDGVRPIVRNNSGTWQYNNHAGAVTGNAIANASYVGTGTFSDTTDTSEIQWINSGNSLLALDNASPDRVEKYNASTAYDITTLTYSQSLGVGSYEIYLTSMHMSPDGMKLYVAGNQNNEFIQYNLTTAFDLSTASFYSTLSFANFGAMWFKPDGTKAFAMNFTNSSVTTFNMSTAWHITGATNAGSHTLQNHGTGGAGAMVWSDDGLNLYVSFPSSDTVKHYTIGTAWDVSTASASPNSMSYASQSSNMTGLAFNSDFTEMHTASGANYYRYSTTQSAYATTATWVDGTTNDELYTLQQALGAQAFNRMDKTQLDAIPDANHFTLGNSLDLMIALRMDTAASTLPTSDGVTLNYDAAALNEGAVLGTDYDFFHPSANKVQIKSLAAQNLKIRVV